MDSRHGALRPEWGYLHVPPRLFIERSVGSSRLVDVSIHAAPGEAVIDGIDTGIKTPQSENGCFHPSGTRWRELERTDRKPGIELLALSFYAPSCPGQVIAWTSTTGEDVDYARFDFLIAENQSTKAKLLCIPRRARKMRMCLRVTTVYRTRGGI